MYKLGGGASPYPSDETLNNGFALLVRSIDSGLKVTGRVGSWVLILGIYRDLKADESFGFVLRRSSTADCAQGGCLCRLWRAGPGLTSASRIPASRRRDAAPRLGAVRTQIRGLQGGVTSVVLVEHQIATRTWQRIEGRFCPRSGRRVGLARLTRRGRANTGMCERRGPSDKGNPE